MLVIHTPLLQSPSRNEVALELVSFMISIEENFSLKSLNTFGIDVKARYFCRIHTPEEIRECFSYSGAKNKLIIGGGSNILFQSDFDGLVIRNEIKNRTVIKEDNDHVWIHAGAGEIWHEFVLYCIENNWAGIENLSLIPGCVGAAPMQNIGAYGVEVKDVIESVHTINLETFETCHFTNSDCQFGYRESIFKHALKNKHCITGVIFKLSKNPSYKISYGAIQDELNKFPDEPLSIRKISNAVIQIRKSKLPDPAVIGNAGSFFKNPEVPKEMAEKIKVHFPDLVSYPVNESTVKLAAGWLIEKAGWKGYTEGSFGVHKLQALVLVNYGGATGDKILELSGKIIESVYAKFGVTLEREVNII